MPNRESNDASFSAADWQEIYSICDRFEAAWENETSPPKLEDFLVADWPAAQQLVLFRDLLMVELDRRLAKGERPRREEYYRRFVDYVDEVEEAFAAQETQESQTQASSHTSGQETERAADWHLVFGLLALQNGLISREQLVAAFTTWTSGKSKPLDQILEEDGALDRTAAETLRQLVALHVQRHGGEPQQTLMALSGSDLPAARDELAQLHDTDLQRSIATLSDVDSAVTQPPTMGEATSTSGRFRILRPLPGAKGGMGEISIARDEELGRQVALKQILSDKADHAAYRQKFQVEAEITGNLEHPGIVPIYGLGIDNDGRPYYAMRLVHGDNLAAQIKSFHQRLASGEVDYNSVAFYGLVDRLIDVAQAIRYAHSRGVLHRDLKPGNILVGKYGETLVIDWGLARLPQTDERETKEPSSESQLDSMPPLNIRSGSNVDATMQGQILGTVGYAPPEQLNGQVDQITERSDVYALGAILYQILLGDAPISTKGKRPLDEVIRDTIEGKIVPPRRERRGIPKSLSAVCMQALDREPDNRYAAVEDFIAELENWKADQPVAAAPDSLADRVLRLARRHRAAALATAAALLGIAIVATVAFFVVNRAWIGESKALAKEAEARTKAETLANRNQTVVDAFVAAFRSPDPENEGVTSSMTALDVLEQARTEIESDKALASDELTRATLIEAVGRSLYSLGAYTQSNAAFEEAFRITKTKLGENHPETLNNMNNLADGYRAVGQLTEALPLYEEALRKRKAELGEDHPETLTSMNNLALCYRVAGRFPEALQLYEQAVRLLKTKLGDDHPRTLITMNNLALCYDMAGRLGEALPLYEQSVRLQKVKLGEDHPDTLTGMNNLAQGYQAAGRLTEALPIYEETLRLRKTKLGDDHRHTLTSMQNLADGYRAVGRLEEALQLFEEALRLQKATLGEDHPDTLISMNNLAIAYQQAGRLDEALQLFEETLRLKKPKLGEDHPETLATMGNVAIAYYAAGRLNEALQLVEETVRLKKANVGEDHPDTLASMINLATFNQAAGRLTEALTLFEHTVRQHKAKLSDDHPHTLIAVRGQQSALLEAGKFEQAIQAAEDWIGILERFQPPDRTRLAPAEISLAEALSGIGRYSEAMERLNDAFEIDEIDNRERLRARNIQGAILASQEKWGEAESLLVESAESLAEQLAEMNFHFRGYVPRAHQRVITMYEAWGKPEQVAEWKAKLSEVNAEIERLRNGATQPIDASDDNELDTEAENTADGEANNEGSQ